MNDVISAVLGEKQRILLDALRDFNEAAAAAHFFDPEGNYVTLYLSTDAPVRAADRHQQPRPVVSKRVAVSPYEIKELVVNAIDSQRDVVIAYRDSEGERTTRTISPIRWREGRFRQEYALLVARDVAKNDIRHFRLDRIERAEDA